MSRVSLSFFFFFFQAEDGIRDATVTGVQTCALPISRPRPRPGALSAQRRRGGDRQAARRHRQGGGAQSRQEPRHRPQPTPTPVPHPTTGGVLWDSEPYRPTSQERHDPVLTTPARQTLTSLLRSRSTSRSARRKPTPNTCTSTASPALIGSRG